MVGFSQCSLAQLQLRVASSSLRLQSGLLRSRSRNGIWSGQDWYASIRDIRQTSKQPFSRVTLIDCVAYLTSNRDSLRLIAFKCYQSATRGIKLIHDGEHGEPCGRASAVIGPAEELRRISRSILPLSACRHVDGAVQGCRLRSQECTVAFPLAIEPCCLADNKNGSGMEFVLYSRETKRFR